MAKRTKRGLRCTGCGTLLVRYTRRKTYAQSDGSTHKCAKCRIRFIKMKSGLHITTM